MELTVYNPQKGRLETIFVEFTAENTTRFNPCEQSDDVAMITDWNGDLLTSGAGRNYPVRIYNTSRMQINYDRNLAKQMQQQSLNQ